MTVLRAVKVARARRSTRAVWDDAIERAALHMQRLTRRFAAGELTEAEYVLGMRSLTKALHMGALAAGSGGVDRVTKTDLRRLGPVLRVEYRHLAKKVGRIEAGADGETEARLVTGYAERAISTYENARRAKTKATEERRVTHAGESCADCEREAGKGWQPKGTLRRIGDSSCAGRCRCAFEYRGVA